MSAVNAHETTETHFILLKIGGFVLILMTLILGIGEACADEASGSRLLITPLSSSQIRLDWMAGFGGMSGLVIERSMDHRDYVVVGTVEPDTSTFTDTGLQTNQLYIYRVYATNGHPEYSAWNYGATLALVTSTNRGQMGGMKMNLLASWTPAGTVQLSWMDRFEDETGFVVMKSLNNQTFTPCASVGPGITTYKDMNVTNNTIYSYQIKVLGPNGSTNVSESTYSSLGTIAWSYTDTLQPPTGVTGTVVTTSRNDVFWTYNGTNQTGFSVLMSWDGVNYQLAGTNGPDERHFHHDGVFDGIPYRYCVVVQGPGSVYSLPSLSCVVQTRPCNATLPAPSELCVTNAPVGMTLRWTDHSTNETGFAIERGIKGSRLHFGRIAVVGPNDTQYTDLSGNKYQTYRVQALGNAGDSRYSNPWFRMSSSDPAAPHDLSVNVLSAINIRLTWSGDAYASYYVERSLDGANFKPVALATSPYNDEGLQPNTIYWYRIRGAPGVYSRVVRTNTLGIISAPAVPAGLSATGVSTGQINLRWDTPATDTDQIVVECSMNGGVSFEVVATLIGRANCFSDTGLTLSHTNAYRIKAVNTYGESATTASVSAETLVSDPAILLATLDMGCFKRLTVQGTDANDTILVSQSGSDISVTVNGGSQQIFAGPFGELVIHGKGGDDTIIVDHSVSARALAYGGQGNNILQMLGSGKNTIVTVGDGMDFCQGNGIDTRYWVDEDGVDTVQSSGLEQSSSCIHRIAKFYGNISKRLDGQSISAPYLYANSNKRYPNNSLWGGGPVMFDITQGLYQDCNFSSFWQSVADVAPEVLEELAVDLGDGTYAVKYGDLMGDLYVRMDGGMSSLMSTPGPNGSQWWMILEKSYLGYSLPQPETRETPISIDLTQDAETVYATVQDALNRKCIVRAGSMGEANLDAPVVRQEHWYSMVGVVRAPDGSPRFILRNPYGPYYAMDHWYFDPQQGLITLTYDQLRSNFLTPIVVDFPLFNHDLPRSPLMIALAGTGGTVAPTGQITVINGANMSFDITPDRYYRIQDVMVDGVSVGVTNRWTFVGVTNDHTLAATFAAIVAGKGTPQWWLASYGWTNNFDSMELLDQDGDRMFTWEEYLAGTNPTNAGSALTLDCLKLGDEQGRLVLRWQSVKDKIYTIQYTTNLCTRFMGVLQSNIQAHAPMNTYTVSVNSANGFYRIGLEGSGVGPE